MKIRSQKENKLVLGTQDLPLDRYWRVGYNSTSVVRFTIRTRVHKQEKPKQDLLYNH